MFAPALSFLRPIQLAELGDATSLSNRNLVWPYFLSVAAASPVTGWGVGAGKIIIPVTSHLTALIGTNAAHDEYLRIGAEGGALGLALLMTLIFIAFAIHSATDNTLIATTSSVFFIWVSAVFASAAERRRAPA
jgi:O-antigen ligase